MDLQFYWKDSRERLYVGSYNDLIKTIRDDYTAEDFFSMISDCYKWELPIIGEVNPVKCFEALAPEMLDDCIEEEREYRADEIEQLLGEAEPWEVYHTYGFDIFAVPSCIRKDEYPKFIEQLKNFLKDTEYPF